MSEEKVTALVNLRVCVAAGPYRGLTGHISSVSEGIFTVQYLVSFDGGLNAPVATWFSIGYLRSVGGQKLKHA